MEQNYFYYKNAIKNQRLPLAYVDLDLLDLNIKKIVEVTKDRQIRIATKSIRSLDLIKRILNSSSKFNGVMSYHPEEALFLSENGIDNILLGYPTTQMSLIKDICKELKNNKTIIFMVDSVDHLNILEKIALSENVEIKVCVDVDLSSKFGNFNFGVRRSSIKNENNFRSFLAHLLTFKKIKLVGLMGYEAQIAGVPDYTNSIVKNWIIKSLKSYSLNEISSKRKLFNSIIEEFKIRLDFVNGGGTGSVSSTIKDDSVTEVTIGSGFYSPTLFDKYTNFRYLPAAGFALEVTRRPDQTHWTCHGGGYIGSGSTGKEKNPTPYLPENLKITDIEGAGEVQTPILDNSCETIQLGDPVFFRHAKAGELCERFNELFLISNGRVIDKALTYRGQRKCFL